MIRKLLSLKHHAGFMKYFQNVSWLFAEKILRLFVGLFVGIWVARYLGPEQYGLLSYVGSFVGLFIVFSTFGLDSIVIRELIKDEERTDILIGTAFCLKLAGALLLLVLLGIAVQFTSNDMFTNGLIFLVASATFFQSFNVIDFYFQSKVLSKYVVYVNIVSLLVSSCVKIVLLMLQAPLVAFVAIFLLDSLVVALGYLYIYTHRNLSIRRWHFDRIVARSLLRESWPLILSGVAVTTYMKIDQVMLQNMLGNEAVGYYSAAVRLSDIWLFVTVSITGSLFPAIINAKKQSEALYYERMLNLYRLLTSIALAISAAVYFFSEQIVTYTYGDQYHPSVMLLQLYVWSILFVFINNGARQWYLAENLQHIETIRLGLGAVLNVVLNLLWIREYGVAGAAYATLVSYALTTYFGNLLHRKTVRNFKLQSKALLTFYDLKGAFK